MFFTWPTLRNYISESDILVINEFAALVTSISMSIDEPVVMTSR